jgi:hypothetical protein
MVSEVVTAPDIAARVREVEELLAASSNAGGLAQS